MDRPNTSSSSPAGSTDLNAAIEALTDFLSARTGSADDQWVPMTDEIRIGHLRTLSVALRRQARVEARLRDAVLDMRDRQHAYLSLRDRRRGHTTDAALAAEDRAREAAQAADAIEKILGSAL